MIYFRKTNPPTPFHITEVDYAQLIDGNGKCYGRTPWGPWCRLKIFRYEVVGIRIVRSPEELKRIEEDMFE